MRGEGRSCWVSVNEYSCTHGAQIKFGDLTPYLTYDWTWGRIHLTWDAPVVRTWYYCTCYMLQLYAAIHSLFIFYDGSSWSVPQQIRGARTYRARICKHLRSPGIKSEELIPASLCFRTGPLRLRHGLINDIDNKSKCCHKKILTCKGTLRQCYKSL